MFVGGMRTKTVTFVDLLEVNLAFLKRIFFLLLIIRFRLAINQLSELTNLTVLLLS